MTREQRPVTAAQERLGPQKLEEAGRDAPRSPEGSGGSPAWLTRRFPRVVRVNFCGFSHPVVVLGYGTRRKPAKLGREG